MKTIELASLRLNGVRLIAAVVAALALCVVAGAAFVPIAGKWPVGIFGVVLAVLPGVMAMQARTDAAARLIVSLTAMSMPVLLLFVFEGQSWQVDLHMMFFALLAMVAILCDWKAVCASAALVAVHHIGFGLLEPAWVFGGGTSLGRIALHAVILIVEAGTLMWLGNAIMTLIERIETENAERQRAEAGLAAERALQADTVAVVTTSLADGLAALSEGDFTAEIEIGFPEGYGMLRSNFNSALASLRHLIGSVSESAAGIQTGSVEIAEAAEALARRTEVTAGTLEETSAALSQIDEHFKASSETSGTTAQRTNQAIAVVGDGRATADEAVQAMGRVSESAKGIDSVIEGLDKIAFQTRVLAMNAAVEAGRAGDAGRGFAVVADLVSALAMRAEEEAKRARDQLTVTQTEIGTAVEAVRKVDGAFQEISTDVAGVHSLVKGMAEDNAAQSLAISQISAAVASMDRTTQQNAAMVEETSAAARNLSVEVDALNGQAAQFRIESSRQKGPVHFQPSPETIAARAQKTGSVK